MLSTHLRQKLFSAVLAGSIALSLTGSAFSQEPQMLIRTIPMEVSGYPEAQDMDQYVTSAETTKNYILATGPLLLHMEALRRAYTHFGTNTEEKQKLLTALKERYMASPETPEYFFDYGYAQLVMDGNKNGLFFLRKANDKLLSPYTSLAYGLAQVDIDRLVENALPTDLTTRKMDVTYKLKDALVFNKDDVLPGIWPTYINIINGLKEFPAFESLVNEDVTVIYVPYGSSALDRSGTKDFVALANSGTETDTPLETQPSTSTTDLEPTCEFSSTPNWSILAQSKAVDLDNDQTPESVNFFNGDSGKPYQVLVLNSTNRVIGELTSYKAPYITEDLEGDGKFELVVRQFDREPYNPLAVYRWNGSCYAKDKRISAYFK